MDNNDLVTTIVSITILLLALTGFIIIFTILHHKRKTKHQIELTTIKQVYQQELLKTQLEIQEQTLQNISQEIHDNIGQVLSLAKLNLNILLPQCDHLPLMADTHHLVSGAINDLRNLSKSLNSDRITDIDLIDSIQHELQLLEKTKLFTICLNVTGDHFFIEKDKKIILFRMFQEIINNTIKHANADCIKVFFNFLPDAFQLTISDNGKGFLQSDRFNGIGLRNLRNRSELIGATCEILTTPGQGVKTSIILPLVNR